MKSIFDSDTSTEILMRIDQLHTGSKAQWGKMNVAEMVHHCITCEEYYQGKIKIDRSFIGRVLGRIALKGILKNDEAKLKRNSPTAAAFRATGITEDLESAKKKWKQFIQQYDGYNNSIFLHWFFGPMSKEQLGQFIYKHSDHHLRQFGV